MSCIERKIEDLAKQELMETNNYESTRTDPDKYLKNKEYLLSKYKEIPKNLGQFKTDVIPKRLMSSVKKLVFQEYQLKDFDLHGGQKKDNYTIMAMSFRYMIEIVMGLTMEEYLSLYSTKFNAKYGLSHIIRKIVDGAPKSIINETLFDTKRTLFKVTYPDKYFEHFKSPTAVDIFFAKGEIKNSLTRAGKIKFSPNKQNVGAPLLNNGKFSTNKSKTCPVYRGTYNHGGDVDKIVYWALTSVLSTVYCTTEELFYILANDKLKNFGCMKIIKSRECYDNPLDFYMFNSPIEFQKENIKEYLLAREKSPKIEPNRMIENICKAFEIAKEKHDLSFSLDERADCYGE